MNMIDYIPPDIPPVVVEYVEQNTKNNDDIISGKYVKYLTIWKNNYEIYVYGNLYKKPTLTGLPPLLIYDCHDIRRPTISELHDIHWFMPKYIVSSNIKSEHLCHRDLDDFNQHNTPNPYKKKVRYFTPRYIPKAVVEYANQMFPISWHPGTHYRYIKYLTTYENKYEVYSVYWTNPQNNHFSLEKYILYDCKNVREYQNESERISLILLKSKYSSEKHLTFCKNK